VKNIFKQIFRKRVSKMENENNIQGGLADDMVLEEIAAKHNVPVEELKKELEKGIAVEKEHTSDEKIAEEIAMDHLVENPKYYESLMQVEKATTPAETQVDIKKLVADAVVEALKKFEETKTQEIELAKAEVQKKAQNELELIKTEAKKLADENAELRRTQPTGVPKIQGQFGNTEPNETERAHETAKNYRNGYKGY
jgi:hypothetical protein